ncbi:MAG TPA: ascorbate-dependent monooxygenase [Thermoanaerobaculia bacterium]
MAKRLLLALAVFTLIVGARQRAVRPINAPQPGVPTFSNEVVRIFQQHCQSCHRDGDIAPFALTTYEEARPWAQAIKFMTSTRRMPPWKPVAGCGDFADERRLTDAEIETIAKWVDGGAPEGNRAQLPAPLPHNSAWTLGEPDAIFSYPVAYMPPASGDTYRCFTVPTNLAQDAYVSGIDVQPGDRGSVHHVIAFIDPNGASVALDEADPAPGYSCFGDPGFELTADATLGGWAPGYRAFKLPPEVALRLPANSRIVLQVHYSSHTGSPHEDQTRLGIYYAQAQPRQLLRIIPVVNNTFEIPAGASDYRVTAGIPVVPFPVHVWVIAPHMHLLGRSMKVETTAPGGATACLINIDDWDFNWQAMYRYKEPIAIPAWSSVSLTATYDNSADNFRNPNHPPKAVRWGEATTDEMCIAFLGVTIDGENLANGMADASALVSR